MKEGEAFEFVARKKNPRYMPKKLLRHTKIPITDKYSCNATVWIADTPESNFKPTINLTLDANGIKLRFCFQNTVQLISTIENLRHFVGGLGPTINRSHETAIRQYVAYHEEQKLPPLDDYTVYTVIQEEVGKGRRKRKVSVNRNTGEILDDG